VVVGDSAGQLDVVKRGSNGCAVPTLRSGDSDRLTPDPRIVNRLDLPDRRQLLEHGVLGIDHDVSLDR